MTLDANFGLGVVGVRKRDNGLVDLVAVDTIVSDDPVVPCRTGLGGPRYFRRLLESVLLLRGGPWPPDAIDRALDLLQRIDGRNLADRRFEQWTYAEHDGEIRQTGQAEWIAAPDTALQTARLPSSELDASRLMTQLAARAAEEMARPTMDALWSDPLSSAAKRGPGVAATALLLVRAREERAFLKQTAAAGDFAATPFHKALSVRYVRSRLLLDRMRVDDPLSWPDLTDLARTILLLSAANRLTDAKDLGQAVRPLLEAGAGFLPPVARMSLAWASGHAMTFDAGADVISGTSLERDCATILEVLPAADPANIAACLQRCLDARNRQAVPQSDAAHTDFDDPLMTLLPLEVAAVSAWRREKGLAPPKVEHPLCDLPTARIPDLSDRPLAFGDLAASTSGSDR